jgi:hypothetical protein
MIKLDALGNEIIFGRNYGYSTDQSGITGINIGTVESVTPKGYITILVKRRISQYATNSERYENLLEKRTSVKPIKLFPL